MPGTLQVFWNDRLIGELAQDAGAELSSGTKRSTFHFLRPCPSRGCCLFGRAPTAMALPVPSSQTSSRIPARWRGNSASRWETSSPSWKG